MPTLYSLPGALPQRAKKFLSGAMSSKLTGAVMAIFAEA